MTSFHNIWFSKLHILWNLKEGISLPNFIGLDCLDKILRRLVENTPQIYTLLKSPVLIVLTQTQNKTIKGGCCSYAVSCTMQAVDRQENSYIISIILICHQNFSIQLHYLKVETQKVFYTR